jgi:7-cyano-7-deazaguanine synthase
LTESNAALVLFSGGQDSTTCLAWALSRFDRVETLGFDYGQRHRIELECRGALVGALRAGYPLLASRLGEDHTIDLTVLGQISDSALTGETEITLRENGLPSTFVPGRNLIFLTMAAALAYRRGLTHIVGGMCETDYSGYPDCRDATIRALETAINLGMDTVFTLDTPLMWIDKAATWRLAEALGGSRLVDLIREETHTCYMGERGRKHEWGCGCGECPACVLRAKGYRQYRDGRRAISS